MFKSAGVNVTLIVCEPAVVKTVDGVVHANVPGTGVLLKAADPSNKITEDKI